MSGEFSGADPITPQFNHTPEPAVTESFDAAAMSNDQAQQLESQRQNLEAQRAVPEVQGMEYTYGGTVEQSVHQTTNEQMAPDREREIAELTERLDRRNAQAVKEEPPPPPQLPDDREAQIQELAGKFKTRNGQRL